MRRLVRTAAAALVGAAAALAAGTAFATIAMPRPLERKVWDADLVVVAKLRTKPAHPGDEFEVYVERTLKGDAGTGPVRVLASHFYTGCCPEPDDAPKPDAIEKRGKRVLLFLDKPKDGARQSSDPIVMDPDEQASAWFYDNRPAALAPDAIAALMALDAEDDAAAAAKRWAAGLDGDSPLLVTALLHRAEAGTHGGDADFEYGPDLVARARRDFAAGRARLLEAIARHADADDIVLRMLVFNAAANTAPARDAGETASFERIARSAREWVGDGTAYDGRAALRFLCASADAQAIPELARLLRTKKPHETVDAALAARLLLIAAPAQDKALRAAVRAVEDDDPDQAGTVHQFFVTLKKVRSR